MAHLPTSALRAGPFSIDPERLRVTRGDAVIALSGQPLQILVALVTAAGRVVTREELRVLLWPDANRIDTGRRLNTAVRALREALGDSAERPAFVETARGR
jgi:DNA-binding winged helix-turn-helix (wHTH) protein